MPLPHPTPSHHLPPHTQQVLQRSAGDESMSRDELAERYQLPVFTVSSTDYMKLAGIQATDGEPQVGSA